jgi:hypothetical protein
MEACGRACRQMRSLGLAGLAMLTLASCNRQSLSRSESSCQEKQTSTPIPRSLPHLHGAIIETDSSVSASDHRLRFLVASKPPAPVTGLYWVYVLPSTVILCHSDAGMPLRCLRRGATVKVWVIGTIETSDPGHAAADTLVVDCEKP